MIRSGGASLFAVAVMLGGCGSDSGDDGGATDAAASTPDAATGPDAAQPDAGTATTFTRYTVSTDLSGPAWVTVADLDDDGVDELVVSSLGVITELFAGDVTIFERGADLGDWTPTVLSTGFKFTNRAKVVDLDGDDDLDIMVPAGFFACQFFGEMCGAISWFEQTDAGWQEHEIVTGSGPFYHGFQLVDLDGDDVDDMVTVAETFSPPDTGTAVLQMFKGDDSAARFEATPVVLADGLGGLPAMHDIDGDGDVDFAAAEFFFSQGASFTWMEQTDAGWVRHVIDDQVGPSIELAFIEDFYGDGKIRAVGSNHVNDQRDPPDAWESAIYAYEIPADPTEPWPRTKLSEGIQSRPGDLQTNRQDAPGIFGHGDVDGDGDIDLVVSGDGDDRVFWIEQTSPGQFATHVLETGLGQAGGMVVTDLDGDGKAEIIVTGYEANALYIYERD